MKTRLTKGTISRRSKPKTIMKSTMSRVLTAIIALSWVAALRRLSSMRRTPKTKDCTSKTSAQTSRAMMRPVVWLVTRLVKSGSCMMAKSARSVRTIVGMRSVENTMVSMPKTLYAFETGALIVSPSDRLLGSMILDGCGLFGICPLSGTLPLPRCALYCRS